MDNTALFHYLTPLLFPLMPTHGGQLIVGLDLKKILDIRTASPLTGAITLDCVVMQGGEAVAREKIDVTVSDGIPEAPYFWRQFPCDGLGYAEISILADRPIFRRIDLPAGYGLLSIPDYGTLTVIPDAKFARPMIIEQMQATKTFCLVHSAGHRDSGRDQGNSYFFVNPYEQDIVATLQSGPDRRIRQKIPAKTAACVPVDGFLADGEWGCVMITGNNRIPVWDIRHRHSDPATINSIDHLDVFRGGRTYKSVGPVAYLKSGLRRLLRERGLIV